MTTETRARGSAGLARPKGRENAGRPRPAVPGQAAPGFGWRTVRVVPGPPLTSPRQVTINASAGVGRRRARDTVSACVAAVPCPARRPSP